MGKTKCQISEERFKSQESEYKRTLEIALPRLKKLEGIVKSKTDDFMVDIEHIQRDMTSVEEDIEQEKSYIRQVPFQRVNMLKTLSPCQRNREVYILNIVYGRAK